MAGVLALFSLAACDPSAGGETLSDVPPAPAAVPYSPDENAVDARDQVASRNAVLKLQKLLAAQGYDPGRIDGVAGQRTAAAIRRFQADSNLKADGEISPALVEELEKQHKEIDQAAAPDTDAASAKPVVLGYENADAPPLYEPGDVFIYSNGQVETVVRVGGNRVVWRADDGSGRTSHPNFMLPWITWHKGSGADRSSAESDAGDLWPIPPGTDRSFQVRTRTEGVVEETVREWRCRGEGKNRITVAAGTFNTVVFSCERSAAPKGEWKRRVWYYAPAVRHYIRRDEIRDGSGRASQVELFAVRPGGRGWPPAARAGLGWAVEDTLQNKPTGEEIVWRSTGVGTEFLISPTMEPVQRDGNLCRSYVLVRGQLENARSYPAIACRDPGSGRWLVPGTSDGAIVGPVVSGKP